MMGSELSRARYLTLGSFIINSSVQTYGMFTKPNIKDIADANHFAFSPHPLFIAAFFSGQAILQLHWIRQIFLLQSQSGGYQALNQTPTSNDTAPSSKTDVNDSEHARAVRTVINYVPVYALGNLCIAAWLFFWLREEFTASQVFVTINTAAQLLAVVALPPLTPTSPALLQLTHLVAKSFAGIGVLDFFDNGGIALRYAAPPASPVRTLTFMLFPLAAAASTPLFGSILLYDVFALAAGQWDVAGGEWGAHLGWTALTTAAVVGFKTLAMYIVV